MSSTDYSQSNTKSRIIATLYNMMGEEKKSIIIKSDETLMNVEDLASGLYILKINTEDKIETHMIAIN